MGNLVRTVLKATLLYLAIIPFITSVALAGDYRAEEKASGENAGLDKLPALIDASYAMAE